MIPRDDTPEPYGDKRAEMLFEAWMRSNGFPEAERAGKTGLHTFDDKTTGQKRTVNRKHDLLGAFDILGYNDEYYWFVQVTKDSGRRERKRKIKKRKLPKRPIQVGSVRVSVVTHEPTYDPRDKRRVSHAWRIDDMAWDEIHGDFVWRTTIVAFKMSDLTPKVDPVHQAKLEEKVAEIQKQRNEKKLGLRAALLPPDGTAT